MEPILRRLKRGPVVVGDGAWGTQLMERGLAAGECPEIWNLTHGEELAEIAGHYLEAGAEILTTNTFGGSPIKLVSYSLADDTEEINRRGVAALRKAADDRAWIAASVGPTGALLEPYGEAAEDDVSAAFERQVGALAKADPDLIVIETMIDLREAILAIQAAKRVAPDLPVVATMTFDRTPRGFFTVMGVTVEQAAAGLEEAGADIIGSNCGRGSEDMVEIAGEFKKHSELPIIIQPNAGLPQPRDGRTVYPETPRFMAEQARRLVGIGVEVIGGCCGTTPEHIAAIRESTGAQSPKSR